jgi:hypothetical protein
MRTTTRTTRKLRQCPMAGALIALGLGTVVGAAHRAHQSGAIDEVLAAQSQ